MPIASPNHPAGARRRLLALAAGLYVGGLSAAEHYQGYAYSVDGARLLYRESHWLQFEHGIERRLVIYSCPDGQAFARKWVDTSPGEAVPDLELLDGRSGYREGVETRAGQRSVYAQSAPAAPLRRAALPDPLPANAVIDAGFDAFVQTRWDALSAQGVEPLPFLVPSQLRFMDFSARRLRDEAGADGELRWFRLSAASWYGFVLPHIDVGYDLESHQLRQYRGLSNIRDQQGRNLNVTIRFPRSERVSDATVNDIERAAAMPLSGRCSLT